MAERASFWTLVSVAALLLPGCVRTDPGREHRVPGGDAGEGWRLVQAYGCTGCHTIPGVPGADATIGPPLTAWAERQYIAGNLVNDPEHLIRWIMEPDEIEPATAMPDLGLTETEARHVAAYLFTLEEATPPAPTDRFLFSRGSAR